MLRMSSRSMLGLRIFACLERLSRFARQSGTLVQIRIRLRLFRLSTFSFVLFRHVLIRRLCLFLVVCSFHSKSNNLRQPTRFVLLFESPRQYALVALVYSNGGHFITVGRSASGCRNGLGAAESSWYVLGASTWWCWDGLRSGGWGEGQPLDSPPLHGTQELRSGSHRWVNYQPHLFIYCRTQ